MTVLRYVLLADGGRDRALLPIIDWAVLQWDPAVVVLDPAFRKHGGRVAEALERAVSEYAADVVFVHRDAERASLTDRLREIPRSPGHVVPVIPVRMTEAWLLIDEAAIRRAADNPSGTSRLALPEAGRIESSRDPKSILEQAWLTASGRTSPRRRKRVLRDRGRLAERVARCIADCTPLRRLPAFRHFETELRARLTEWRQTRDGGSAGR